MDYGFLVILFAIGMIFFCWNRLNNKKKSEDDQIMIYREYWNKSGISGKWWILVLNLAGNLVLLEETLSFRSVKGADLARLAEGFGFMYMILVMWPSILVVICLVFFVRFELSSRNIKRKWLYALLAVTSVTFPVVLLANLGKIIKG